jgi:hypothetical protein
VTSTFTEAELLAALRRRFTISGNGGAGRYAFMTHVRTGAAWDQQEIDAIAVCLWPSDSHALLAFEVKCSRTDWLREIRPDISKSERTRALCDSLTVVAPANVVAFGELPQGWGLIHAARDTDSGDIRLKQHTTPTPRQVALGQRSADEPITRSFLVAMLRAAGAVPGMTSGRRRLPSPATCSDERDVDVAHDTRRAI